LEAKKTQTGVVGSSFPFEKVRGYLINFDSLHINGQVFSCLIGI
jgi:hypothetical protein